MLLSKLENFLSYFHAFKSQIVTKNVEVVTTYCHSFEDFDVFSHK